MASIDSLSSSLYLPPTSQTQGLQSTQGAGSDPDGDGDGGTKVKKSGGHGHGHGQMQNLLMQALQSLGLGGAAGSTGSSSSTQSASATDSDGDADGSTTGASSTKADMRQFMHALFQAVKADSSSAPSATAAASSSTGSDPKASFAAGLSALISQVSSGQAPADLQSAFAKVVNDLQGSSASSTATTASGTGSTAAVSGATSSSQVTLQALLSKMQQNLGYGPASSTPSLSNILSAQA